MVTGSPDFAEIALARMSIFCFSTNTFDIIVTPNYYYFIPSFIEVRSFKKSRGIPQDLRIPISVFSLNRLLHRYIKKYTFCFAIICMQNPLSHVGSAKVSLYNHILKSLIYGINHIFSSAYII